MKAGHVLVGPEGNLVSMDAAFCGIMRSTRNDLCGRFVLDVTAPADRDECATALQTLRDTGRPFEIIKRFQRDDRSLIWVKNTVSISLESDQPGLIFATIEPVATHSQRCPAVLLDLAKHHINLLSNRSTVCDPQLLSDPAWDMVLAVYIAEAEGGSFDLSKLAGYLNRPIDMIRRWVKVLLSEDVIEIEYGNLSAHAEKSYRLTAVTIDRLERFLLHDHRQPLYPPISLLGNL